LPLLLIVGLIVRLTSPGSALYSQQRVGHGGTIFRIWKFRTMVDSADRQLSELLVQHNRNSEPLFKVPDDPRITAVGRFLRRSSIDALPQLFNVLRGEMSLVGPRPERPYFVKRFGDMYPGYRARHRLPAGVTGWSQIHGLRGNTSIEERATFDNHYIENWSLSSDLKILIKTVPVLVKDGGGDK
jgi:lipopolysaccharide/colanic/teichoic acid biosynthesis glycosyltransferase